MARDRDDVNWLPVRIEPVRGEAFGSFCRRLADANGLTVNPLKRICIARYPESNGILAAVARAIGVRTATLRSATLPGDAPPEPVKRDVGKDLVLGEAALDVAVAVAPRAQLLDDPGGNSGGGVGETDRGRLLVLLGHSLS